MITLDETLDSIMKLDFSSREILLEILKKRLVEERRVEIEKNAKQAKAAFKSGKLKSTSAKDAISILNSL
jgi:uncharacterized protein YdaU (DUF1376 family)